MRYVLEKYGLEFRVISIGDDYKAALLIPPTYTSHQIGELANDIRTSVPKDIIASFTHKMKSDDSYCSETYLSVCKSASVKQIELPQGVRKIQKTHGWENGTLPTLDSYISSAFSNAHSASSTIVTPLSAYAVAVFWSYYRLSSHADYANLPFLEMLSHLMVPSCVGGLPVMYFYQFFARGESDHLSGFCDLLTWISHSYPRLYLVMSKSLVFQKVSRSDVKGLLMDPYSLPIQKPSLPTSILKRKLFEVLKPMNFTRRS